MNIGLEQILFTCSTMSVGIEFNSSGLLYLKSNQTWLVWLMA